jgi:hypothetical protein
MLYAAARAVEPPSDWPVIAISRELMSPDKIACERALPASIRVITKLMSVGWLTRSDSFGPPGAAALVKGKIGAATTKPARTQARSMGA